MTLYLDYTVLNDMMINDLERIWKKVAMALRYHSGIYLDGLRKTTKHLSQDANVLPKFEVMTSHYCYTNLLHGIILLSLQQ
jgi:hypothetical protein